METLILVLHVLAALCVIGLVLLQHGKGADMGAAFGSGSAGSLFGASGSANFLSRTTAVMAAVFFLTSLGLTYLSSHQGQEGGVMSTHEEAPAGPASAIPAPTAPAAPAGQGDSKANEVPKQ
jgi:preprotein translocase subunit SecG